MGKETTKEARQTGTRQVEEQAKASWTARAKRENGNEQVSREMMETRKQKRRRENEY